MFRMVKQSFVVLFLLYAAILFPQDTVVPVDQEPAHHLVLDNQYVRVFDVVVPAHTATLMHRHDRDYMFVILGDSEISNERMNEKPVQLTLKDGDTRYSPGGFSHVARNLAATPFHNITIELKNPGAAVCGIGTSAACQKDNETGVVRELFEAEHLTVRLTTLDPGEQTPVHTHAYPHLAVALDNLTFENHLEGKDPVTFSRDKGQFAWVDAGITHYFRNVGKSRARMLAVEFKQ